MDIDHFWYAWYCWRTSTNACLRTSLDTAKHPITWHDLGELIVVWWAQYCFEQLLRFLRLPSDDSLKTLWSSSNVLCICLALPVKVARIHNVLGVFDLTAVFLTADHQTRFDSSRHCILRVCKRCLQYLWGRLWPQLQYALASTVSWCRPITRSSAIHYWQLLYILLIEAVVDQAESHGKTFPARIASLRSSAKVMKILSSQSRKYETLMRPEAIIKRCTFG